MCGELRAQHTGAQVVLLGWVNRRRDLGNVIFIDIRDRSGITQLVFDKGDNPAAHEKASNLRSEFVIAAIGKTRRRDESTVNKNIATGEVEVTVDELKLLNESKLPPFLPSEAGALNEEVRLKYRYIDLRREVMQYNIEMRHKVALAIRQYLSGEGFLEIETPFMTRSTPEGARDYLVPSRVHPGEFYALPQSPQLFKQLLMVAGFDRYYQIVRCFRDEDLRADRQPEFTQIDVETSLLGERAIQELMEGLIRGVFRDVLGVDLPDPFPRLSYAEVIARYGSDKPDLRVPLELTELTDLMKSVDFKVFRQAADLTGGRVAALRVAAELTRKEIDDYAQFVATYGAKGLAYIKVNPDGLQSPIVKFLPENVLKEIVARTGAQTGDFIFFGADKAKVVNDSLGALRVRLGQDKGLVEKGWRALWVVDFPMFEWDEDGKRWSAMHHPFTSPK